MKTKRLLPLVLALTFATATALAQGPGHGPKHGKGHFKKSPEERAKHQTEWMKKDLNLTSEQTQKVEDVNLKYAEERAKLRKEYRAKRKANQTKKDAELIKILSEEQFTKLQELREERRSQRKMRRSHMRDCMKNYAKP